MQDPTWYKDLQLWVEITNHKNQKHAPSDQAVEFLAWGCDLSLRSRLPRLLPLNYGVTDTATINRAEHMFWNLKSREGNPQNGVRRILQFSWWVSIFKDLKLSIERLKKSKSWYQCFYVKESVCIWYSGIYNSIWLGLLRGKILKFQYKISKYDLIEIHNFNQKSSQMYI